ncbi:hypothetical protein H6F76_17940 [Leptolyngbya sp. FACHB-321]|uniref:hypothetical protein n=1 Tax=Leptolyngbya sp. FACHB-321 TaxID=2692807 RepID=UPI0016882C20|nr:hypothetical protein [Leptolyngbya sp. FACHB-321]MBD2036892.1 hypothetical protein [Leptolyngbya sp. FACHB-321]
MALISVTIVIRLIHPVLLQRFSPPADVKRIAGVDKSITPKAVIVPPFAAGGVLSQIERLKRAWALKSPQRNCLRSVQTSLVKP